MTIEDIKEWVAAFNEEALLADGFEDAIIGVCEGFGESPVVAYDRDKCIAVLMGDKNDMDYEEAVEYFEFNVIGSGMGGNSPTFITMLP